MSLNKIKLDTSRLIAAREQQNLTQAKVSKLANKSLRNLSDYENPKIDTFLSAFDLHKLAEALKVNQYQLWGEYQANPTCYYSDASNQKAKWAEYLAEGKFYDLKVSGLPGKGHRDPLLKLIDIYENPDPKLDPGKKLSISLRKRFECDDLVEELTSCVEDPFDEGNNSSWFGARLMVLQVPTVDIEHGNYEDHENGIYHDYIQFHWGTRIHALIDFENFDVQDKPVSFSIVKKIFGGRDIFDIFNYKDPNEGIEEVAKYEKMALDHRPDFFSQDKRNKTDTDSSDEETDSSNSVTKNKKDDKE